jgi:hypothetical protein
MWTRRNLHLQSDVYVLSCGPAAHLGPKPLRYWGFYITIWHTLTRTLYETSLNKWSARGRGRYLHDTQRTQPSAWFEPAIAGIQVATDVRLRPHGHLDWPDNYRVELYGTLSLLNTGLFDVLRLYIWFYKEYFCIFLPQSTTPVRSINPLNAELHPI